VEGKGIGVEEYRQVLNAVNSDENLRQKFIERIQELQI